MKLSIASVLLTAAVFAGGSGPANAEPPVPVGPFTPSLMTMWPTNTPLAFGMDVEAAARVLNTPLRYVSGRHGNDCSFSAPSNC